VSPSIFLGAFAVAFDASGSVTSVRFHDFISEDFPKVCSRLDVADLKGVHGARNSIEVLVQLTSLRMIILSGSDVVDDDIRLLATIPGLKHLWLTNTKLTEQCVDYLAGIEQLETLKLDGTNIDSLAIERLRIARPKLKIEGIGNAVSFK
jgi:hypothetical protein